MTFLGSEVFGYGPRYALVDSVATACLVLAALTWAHAAVCQPRAALRGPDTVSPWRKADAKAIALDILGLAVILVVVGLFMEHLRNAHVLPWSAP